MRVGLEIAVRTTALLGAFLVASAVLARVGDASLAAHQIAFQLFVFLALVLDALAIAAQVLVGRSLGAGDAAGAREAAGRMILWSVVLGAAFGLVLLALRDPLLGLFTPDDAVVEQAHEIWWLFAALMPLNGAVFALDGILIGAGDTRFLMWGMLAASAVYVPVALLALANDWGIVGVWCGLAGADRGPAGDVRRALRGRALGADRRLRPYHDRRRCAASPPSSRCSSSSPPRRPRWRRRPGRRRRRFGPLPAARAGADAGADGRADDRGAADTDRTLLFAIGGGLLALFLVIGYVITRDARETLPEASAAPPPRARCASRGRTATPSRRRRRRARRPRRSAPRAATTAERPRRQRAEARPAHAGRADRLGHLHPRVALGLGLDDRPRRVRRARALEHVVDAASYSARFSRLRQSSSVSFHAFSGSSRRASKRSSCSRVGDVQPELDQHEVLLVEHLLEGVDLVVGALPRALGGEALDALDQHAAVPRAVEHGHPAPARQQRPEARAASGGAARRGVGAAIEATRTWRGSSGSTSRLIAPPLPDASQPSNTTQNGGPISLADLPAEPQPQVQQPRLRRLQPRLGVLLGEVEREVGVTEHRQGIPRRRARRARRGRAGARRAGARSR